MPPANYTVKAKSSKGREFNFEIEEFSITKWKNEGVVLYVKGSYEFEGDHPDQSYESAHELTLKFDDLEAEWLILQLWGLGYRPEITDELAELEEARNKISETIQRLDKPE